jgi:hypothetical protein
MPMAWADDLVLSLERTAMTIGRLDAALFGHPLRTAWVHWTRLEAVRQHSAADGDRIDPHRLAAMLEGLRLESDRARDHGALARAFQLYEYLYARDERQETEVTQALEAIRKAGAGRSGLIGVAQGLRDWIMVAGKDRNPIRAAIPIYLHERGLTRDVAPILSGASSLHGHAPAAEGAWLAFFLDDLAREANEGVRLIRTMERAWADAHDRIGERRSSSRLPRAIDLLAAAPLLGPVRLARLLECTTRGAGMMLDELVEVGVAVEVTGRQSRRLYGMRDLAPIRRETAGPKHPHPGRGRGRPRKMSCDERVAMDAPPVFVASLPLEVSRPKLPSRPDLAVDLEMLLADTDQAIRRSKAVLGHVRNGGNILDLLDPEGQRSV